MLKIRLPLNAARRAAKSFSKSPHRPSLRRRACFCMSHTGGRRQVETISAMNERSTSRKTERSAQFASVFREVAPLSATGDRTKHTCMFVCRLPAGELNIASSLVQADGNRSQPPRAAPTNGDQLIKSSAAATEFHFGSSSSTIRRRRSRAGRRRSSKRATTKSAFGSVHLNVGVVWNAVAEEWRAIVVTEIDRDI